MIASEPEVIIQADVLLTNGCYNPETTVATVLPRKNKIELTQFVEKTSTLCTQQLKKVSQLINLSVLPEGTYRVFDKFDNSIINKININ